METTLADVDEVGSVPAPGLTGGALAASNSTGRPKPAIRRVLTARVRDPLAADWLAPRLARAPWFVVAAALSAGVIAFTAVIVLLLIGEDLRTGAPWRRTLATPKSSLAFVLGPVVPALAVLTWIHLPFVHRAGPIGPSLALTFRAMTGAVWPVTVGLAMCGAVFFVGRALLPDASLMGSYAPLLDSDTYVIVASFVTTGLIWRWLRLAALSVAPEAPPDPPPRCEGCGYDLTHQPENARCPECGLGLAVSLDPQSRPGSGWARAPGVRTWIRTAAAIAFTPSRFYRTLRVRTPLEIEARFARWAFIALGFLVAGLVAAMDWVQHQLWKARHGQAYPLSWSYTLFEAAMAAVAFPLTLAIVSRVVAALASTPALIRNDLPDFRATVKAAMCEAVWMWPVFLWFWFSILVIDVAQSLDLFPQSLRLPLYIPPELVLLFGGWSILLILALLRYRRACRAIRWANS